MIVCSRSCPPIHLIAITCVPVRCNSSLNYRFCSVYLCCDQMTTDAEAGKPALSAMDTKSTSGARGANIAPCSAAAAAVSTAAAVDVKTEHRDRNGFGVG